MAGLFVLRGLTSLTALAVPVSALAFVHMDFLCSELRDLRATDGAPLWDGKVELVVRDATEEEMSAWDAEVALAIREREIDRREDALDPGWFVFLVPYRDPEE